MSRPVFFFMAAITVFLYFELMVQVWFVNLLGGYVIRVWIPPLILFFYIVVRKLTGRNDFFEFNTMNIALLCYSIIGIFAMGVNEPLKFAIKFYLIMIAPVCFYFVIIDIFRDNRDIELMMKVLIYCGFVLTIYQYYLRLQSPLSVQMELITKTGNELALSEAFFGHAEGMFSRGLRGYEAGKNCAFLAPGILFSILFFLKSTSRTKYIYMVMSTYMLVEIIDSLSRTGISSTFVGIAVLLSCIYIYEKRLRSKMLILSLSSLFMVIIYLLGYQFHTVLRFAQLLNILGIESIDRFLSSYGLSSFSSISYLDPHYNSIFDGLKAFLQSPFWGNGYYFTEIIVNEHNRYLFILISAGLFTLIPYMIFLTRLTLYVKDSVRWGRWFDKIGINYGYVFFACQIMFLVKLFNEGMETFYYWIIFALGMAWIRNCIREAPDLTVGVSRKRRPVPITSGL